MGRQLTFKALLGDLVGNDMAIIPDFSVAEKHVLISGGTERLVMPSPKPFLIMAPTLSLPISQLRRMADPGIRYEHLDVRDDAAVEALARLVEKLDVVIHCAGRIARWEEYKPEVFKEILDIHLVGKLRLAKAFRPHLKESRARYDRSVENEHFVSD